jgi:hypothetical protein
MANIRRRRAVASTERAVEIGQVGEAHFSGDVGDPAMALQRITQQHHAPFQPPLQHVMAEALAGLFKQQMHVARRDAEQTGNRSRAQAWISAAALDLAENGGKTRGASATALATRS